MKYWICEDVGLVLNEIKEKLDEKIKYYSEHESDALAGLNIAKKIIDEVADNWTSDEPAQYVLDKLEEKYNG